MTMYFGPEYARKPWEESIPAPVGAPCVYCKELIEEYDMGTLTEGRLLHYECSIRLAVGSVGHQAHECSCYGGNEDDPQGLTLHEAAHAAERYHRMLHSE